MRTWLKALVGVALVLGVTSTAHAAGTCVGGSNDGASCTVASQCPGTYGYCNTASFTPGVATPTVTPQAAASPHAALAKEIGTSSAWLKYLFGGTCTIAPNTISGGSSAVTTCAVPGAAVGDIAFAQFASNGVDQDACLMIRSVSIPSADVLRIRFVNPNTDTCHPSGVQTIQYMVLRLNTHF